MMSLRSDCDLIFFFLLQFSRVQYEKLSDNRNDELRTLNWYWNESLMITIISASLLNIRIVNFILYFIFYTVKTDDDVYHVKQIRRIQNKIQINWSTAIWPNNTNLYRFQRRCFNYDFLLLFFPSYPPLHLSHSVLVLFNSIFFNISSYWNICQFL